MITNNNPDEAVWPPSNAGPRPYAYSPLYNLGGDGYDAFTPIWARMVTQKLANDHE